MKPTRTIYLIESVTVRSDGVRFSRPLYKTVDRDSQELLIKIIVKEAAPLPKTRAGGAGNRREVHVISVADWRSQKYHQDTNGLLNIPDGTTFESIEMLAKELGYTPQTLRTMLGKARSEHNGIDQDIKARGYWIGYVRKNTVSI